MVETTVPTKTDQATELAPTRDEERYVVPPVDIYETAQTLVVVADLPGVEKGGVGVRVDDGVLTIEGRPTQELAKNPSLQEFVLRCFHRQFELPSEVDQEKISAEMKNGVLTVELPMAEAAKPKQIEVKVS